MYEIRPGLYGDTVVEKLYDDAEKGKYCHIIYEDGLRKKHEDKLRAEINALAVEVERQIKSGTFLTPKQLEKYRQYFVLDVESIENRKPGDTSAKKKGRKSKKAKILSFREDYKKTDHAMDQCGFFVLVSSKKITAEEAIDIYSKRDRVEKVFLALKPFLGMDCLGAHSTDSIHIRTFIWLLASILYTKIFTFTSDLRANERNRKKYSTQSIFAILRHIKATFNEVTMKYKCTFLMNKENRKLFEAFGISENDVYEFGASLDCDIEIMEEDAVEIVEP